MGGFGVLSGMDVPLEEEMGREFGDERPGLFTNPCGANSDLVMRLLCSLAIPPLILEYYSSPSTGLAGNCRAVPT